MPLYEYRCASCGDVFEVMQKFSDQPLQEHPGCGGQVEKLLSAPALQFKGSGWYVTDYARNSSAGEKSTDGKPKGETSKGESSDAGKNGSSKPSADPAKDTSSTTKSGR
jgi:putative FmdB family regulatory protein